jgi:hypothetical protein
VLVSVVEIVDTVKSDLRSRIWLCPANEVHRVTSGFYWGVLGHLGLKKFDLPLEVGRVLGEREHDIPKDLRGLRLDKPKNQVVERYPQTMNDIADQNRDQRRDWLVNEELIDALSGLRVVIGYDFVGLIDVDKARDKLFEVGEMYFGPFNP